MMTPVKFGYYPPNIFREKLWQCVQRKVILAYIFAPNMGRSTVIPKGTSGPPKITRVIWLKSIHYFQSAGLWELGAQQMDGHVTVPYVQQKEILCSLVVSRQQSLTHICTQDHASIWTNG